MAKYIYLKNQRRTRRQKIMRTEISWKDKGPRALHLGKYGRSRWLIDTQVVSVTSCWFKCCAPLWNQQSCLTYSEGIALNRKLLTFHVSAPLPLSHHHFHSPTFKSKFIHVPREFYTFIISQFNTFIISLLLLPKVCETSPASEIYLKDNPEDCQIHQHLQGIYK